MAEKKAAEFRKELGLHVVAPLPARQLAHHLGILVIRPEQIPGMQGADLDHLLMAGQTRWSAITLSEISPKIIIINPTHSSSRQESDVMHEIAHIICEHDADTFQQVGSFPFMLRTYNSEQEGEAEWLGAALQLPRVALSWAKRSRMDYTAIAEHFGCSLEIARYRCNVTGVNKQFSL